MADCQNSMCPIEKGRLKKEIERLREVLTVLSSDFDHAFAAESREDTIKNVERIALRALGQGESDKK